MAKQTVRDMTSLVEFSESLGLDSQELKEAGSLVSRGRAFKAFSLLVAAHSKALAELEARTPKA